MLKWSFRILSILFVAHFLACDGDDNQGNSRGQGFRGNNPNQPGNPTNPSNPGTTSPTGSGWSFLCEDGYGDYSISFQEWPNSLATIKDQYTGRTMDLYCSPSTYWDWGWDCKDYESMNYGGYGYSGYQQPGYYFSVDIYYDFEGTGNFWAEVYTNHYNEFLEIISCQVR